MKKKILSLCLVLALAAVAVVGGTLAYFTDTDEATNTFTTANVEIDLIEKQRNEDSTDLENFEDGKVLMPIVGSAQGDSEEVGGVSGLPTAENYVDKIMTIKNLAVDAYVRLYVAIPTALDNVGDAGQNILHFNWNTASAAEGEWRNEVCVAQNVNVNGVQCNVYYRTYSTALAKDAATATPAYIGFYLDKHVNYNNETGMYTITRNGVTEDINFDFSDGVTIPVYAVGVQAAGFTDADAAVDEAFGANFNPWAANN